MSRYYFNFINGETRLDDEGVELKDLSAVRKAAIRATSREMFLREQGHEDFWSGTPAKLWVTDGPNASGQTVLTIGMSASA